MHRIVQPNQANVTSHYVDGPLAQPCSLAFGTPGDMHMLIIGGLTKAEVLAGQVAATMIKPGVLSRPPEPPPPATGWTPGDVTEHDAQFEARVALLSLNLAEAILTESARRRQPPNEEANGEAKMDQA